MLAKSELVAFVTTARPVVSKRFYQRTLGLRLVSDDPFAMVFAVGRTNLRVAKAPRVSPAPYTVLGWKVKDIVREARTLRQRRVRCERFAGMEQDALGIWSAPGGAQVAWFKDPDGNLLSLTQFPRGAR